MASKDIWAPIASLRHSPAEAYFFLSVEGSFRAEAIFIIQISLVMTSSGTL